MFNQIIVSILAFLLMIFPWSGTLLSFYQSASFPGESVVTQNIVDAMNAGDIDALEAMISPDRQNEMDNLPGNIGALIDAIDGEIIRYNWYGSSSSDETTNGTRISRRTWQIRITTATDSYSLYVNWVVINNRTQTAVGMNSMTLYDSDDNILATTYHPK